MEIGSQGKRPKSQEGNVAKGNGLPGRLEVDIGHVSRKVLPILHSCPRPAPAEAVNRSLPLELRGNSRLHADRGGAFLRDLDYDWSIPETLDHRVAGTQRFHNLAYKMATKMEAEEKGVEEMTRPVTQPDT
ncbi:hypothetical protein P7K49_011482 [Saguinus oedipus]|uniref:Uncharacterized protein n=1 Tax=Saguinus oedipus TaxID=9490 RepID=A0ABQ9VQU3_SAGOE|nr:hypothetical protein P7K49_011482 [Saguinus oedipus]